MVIRLHSCEALFDMYMELKLSVVMQLVLLVCCAIWSANDFSYACDSHCQRSPLAEGMWQGQIVCIYDDFTMKMTLPQSRG